MRVSKERAASGAEGLDCLLGGGFPRNQLYLVQGPSGAGKTTLGLQFLAQGASNGEQGLYLGTSETEGEIEEVMHCHGWPMKHVTIHHQGQASHESDVMQTMLHPSEVELPRIMEALLSKVEQVKPSRLVIDSLTEIRVLCREEAWYRQQLMTLKRYFIERACTVLLTDVPRGQVPILSSLVHGIIELEQLKPAYGPDRRRLRLAKLRGQAYPLGYHDYQIVTGGLAVYPRLVAAEHRQQMKPEVTSTGIVELDKLLGGGLDRGTTIMFLGSAGTGKSLIATQCAVAAAQRGERSALYIFDERIQTLLQRAEGVGLDLARVMNDGMVQVHQIDPAELTPGHFSHLVQEAIDRDGVRLVVIDSLNGYANAMPEERYLSVHLHELSSFLNQRGVTSLFVMAQHGLMGSQIHTPFEVSYISDTVLTFRFFEHQGAMHKAIAVHKRRSGAHESTIRELIIGSKGVSLGQPLSQFRGITTGTPQYMGEKLHYSDRKILNEGGEGTND